MDPNQLFDLFKSQLKANPPSTTKQKVFYLTTAQMKMANNAGEEPHTYIAGFPSYTKINEFMAQCKERLLNKEQPERFANGLVKKILKDLDIQIEETEENMMQNTAQELLHMKANGISCYCIELLHFGFNVSLDRLTTLDRKTGANILNKFMEDFGYEHSGKNTPLTFEKVTKMIAPEIAEQRFGIANEPFAKQTEGDAGNEDVEIDDDIPNASFPPVVINEGGGYASKSSSSGSSSSESGSFSDSGSFFGSDSDADHAQSAGIQ